MTIDWSHHKNEVVELYRNQDLPLDRVREYMKESIRSYRDKIREWGAFKRHQKTEDLSAVSNDSGYSSPSRDPRLTVASPRNSESSSLRSLSTPFRPAPLPRSPNPPPSLPAEPLPARQARPSGITILTSSNVIKREDIQQPYVLHATSSLPPSLLLRSLSAHLQPHAPPPFPAAPRKMAYHRHGGVGADCKFCGVSEPHRLAAQANDTRIEVLVERVGKLQDINKRDVYGNTGLHHLAAAGPDLARLKAFFRAGADLNCKNTDGETFMHHLELSGLEGDMVHLLDLLRGSGFDLKHRTHNGQTILHSLFEHEFSLGVLCEILPTFQTAGNDINAWDNQGYSAVDRLYANWKLMRERGQRSSEGVDNLEQILIYFGAAWRVRKRVDVGMVDEGDGEGGLTSPQRLNEDHDAQACRSIRCLDAQDREMLDIISQSSHEPFSQSELGRNSLHCLAHVIRLNPESPMSKQPPTARLDHVADCIKRGVDLNSFDRFGATPIHSFLSEPRSNEAEATTADIVRLLIEKGADIDMRNRDGDTPLHLACKNGLRCCVDVLLRLGANLHARNRRGRGIIEEAREEARMWTVLEYRGEFARGVARIADIECCIEAVRMSGGVGNPTEAHEYCLWGW
ncbi:hypothetical protein FGG08_004136 [Glutinoglossum americanum]|uniref:Clr5 domain-containing protein n=1 Tax=Glutinoglossum americanum TaxID=1670608 RepID=A0A9P8KXD8_9PEZI|nr:hypothetical protein FGG08_004136 [Glutinoglossum americanum]